MSRAAVLLIAASVFGTTAPAEPQTDVNAVPHLASQGNFKAVESAVKKGADINARFADGRTILHIAIERGRDDLLTFALSKRVDIDARDRMGDTPLIYAARLGQIEMLRKLLGKKARVLELNKNCHSAVDEAAGYGNKEAHDLLRNVSLNKRVRFGSECAKRLIALKSDFNTRRQAYFASLLTVSRWHEYAGAMKAFDLFAADPQLVLPHIDAVLRLIEGKPTSSLPLHGTAQYVEFHIKVVAAKTLATAIKEPQKRQQLSQVFLRIMSAAECGRCAKQQPEASFEAALAWFQADEDLAKAASSSLEGLVQRGKLKQVDLKPDAE